MMPALWIAKTGLDAQQTNISFKKGRPVFEDLLYQKINQPGGRSSADSELPTGLMIGVGAKVMSTQKTFTQGDVQTTDNALDLMISGSGFFEIELPDGTTAYTRNGQFAMDDEGTIVTSGSGYTVQPAIQVPNNATSITVSSDGQVSVTITGQAEVQVLGQLNVSRFVNPQGLEPIGENLFIETQSSGAPIQGAAGQDGMGSIKQGMLETANVNVTEELVNLIQAQRVYEMNSKVLSAVNDMLSSLNSNT